MPVLVLRVSEERVNLLQADRTSYSGRPYLRMRSSYASNYFLTFYSQKSLPFTPIQKNG
jgi:hypothetical protein